MRDLRIFFLSLLIFKKKRKFRSKLLHPFAQSIHPRRTRKLDFLEIPMNQIAQGIVPVEYYQMAIIKRIWLSFLQIFHFHFSISNSISNSISISISLFPSQKKKKTNHIIRFDILHNFMRQFRITLWLQIGQFCLIHIQFSTDAAIPMSCFQYDIAISVNGCFAFWTAEAWSSQIPVTRV